MDGNVWFTADTHFNHANIIKYCSRPFLSADENGIRDAASSPDASPEQKAAWAELKLSKDTVERHDRQLIENWNGSVSPEDTVYHLGDFCFGNKKHGRDLIARLNGRICMVRGNHDRLADSLEDEFAWIKDYYELTVDDGSCYRGERYITLFHYAMRVWNASHYGTWHLYGHSHGDLPDNPGLLSIDVGVDAVACRAGAPLGAAEHYRPISYDEVTAIMAAKQWVAPDLER